MARQISRAEAWERAHEVFTQVNFNAFDYNSMKESLLDYVKLYYPEDFNDYIESSEFIAVLELFSYIGELLAYRLDLNAHENFITTAERKESVLRLAKMISYKASRNIPARGLVKMSSIQTTETVIDSAGRNLAGRTIFWNDPNNPDWKEQFTLIINRVLEQEFGTVNPDERVQVDDVLFELYTFNNNPLGSDDRSVIPYTTVAGSGISVPMELVPTQLTDDGPIERRPEINAKISVLYANDGLGDSSDTTGFMFYTKQGTLTFQTQTFDGVTPNQTFDVSIDNINETDLWVNNVSSDTGEILANDPYEDLLPHLVAEDLRYGEWVEVDLANAQNIIFNTNRNRHKYEVEALDNDQVRLVFGDGEFSDIPNGTFHIWYRTSANEDLFIERSSVIDQNGAFSYTDATGSIQTLSFTFSLISSLQNASASEDIEHIRRVAPSVYYTQDRMVNGRDYNTFMLQDPSILRLRAINRTFAGDSKYIAWHDPRENYEDVKLFGDDMAMYWNEEEPEDGGLIAITSPVTAEQLLENTIEPLLSTTDFYAKLGPELQAVGLNPADMRREFKGESQPYVVASPLGLYETEALLNALDLAATTAANNVFIYYSVPYDEWTPGADPTLLTANHPCDPAALDPGCVAGDAEPIYMIKVTAIFGSGGSLSGWDVRWRTRRLIAHSEDTKFWNTNTTVRVVNFDTLNSVSDTIVVLEANKNANGDELLEGNRNFAVLGQELVEQNLPDAGLPDIHRLSVLPEDLNEDGISDDLLQSNLFDAVFIGTWPDDPASPQVGDIPTNVEGTTPYLDLEFLGKKYNVADDPKGLDSDVEVYIDGVRRTFEAGELLATTLEANELIRQRIAFNSAILSELTTGSPTPVVQLIVKDYVYLSREDNLSSWIPQPDTDTIRTLYITEDTENPEEQLYRREAGRYPLNFAWFHFTPRLNLVDPAASNIIDIYIVTVGYYLALTTWLANRTDVEPTAPTPLELRTAYNELLDNKMISDTVVLHSGLFKIMFGSRAVPQLRCRFKVIRPAVSSLTDNQVKVRIVDNIRQFFDIDNWEFGETFYFTELAASIHSELGPEIDSIVLVPTYAQNQFGDLFQVQARENELFIPDVSTSDIEIVQSYTPENIRQDPS